MNRRQRLILSSIVGQCLFAVLALFSGSAAAVDVPALSGPVVDQAAMLSPNQKQQIEQLLTSLWRGGGSQIAVLTVPDLGGMSIEEFGIKVTDKWKLGDPKRDNGALLLIAKAERSLRIEVGQGLEGQLTDAYSKRIIEDSIKPYFQAGQIDQGVLMGLIEMIKRTDPGVDVTKYIANAAQLQPAAAPRAMSFSSFFIIVIFIIVSIIMSALQKLGLGGSSRRRPWHHGGGGWGSGSGGGGGFSGGGGGFSGGGASGRW